MRASRILAMRPRAIAALAQLCEEKTETIQPTTPPSVFIPPRLSFPPQTPYTVGSGSMRPKGASAERLSPQPGFFEPENRQSGDNCVPSRTPPDHMAPKRTQWTSPPPPEAPPATHAIFEDQLDQGLALATSSTMAREAGKPTSFPEHVDLLSDEERRSDATESDDVRSVRSFTEGSYATPLASTFLIEPATFSTGLSLRGRVPARSPRPSDDNTIQVAIDDATLTAYKAELLRRSHSGPPNAKSNRFSWPSATPTVYPLPFGPSISTSQSPRLQVPDTSTSTNTVFYETTASQPRFSTYPTLGSQSHTSSNVPFHTRSYFDHPANNPIIIDISKDGSSSPPPRSPFSHAHSHTSSTATITSRVQLISQHRSRSPRSPLRSNMHPGESPSPRSGSGSPSPSPTLMHSHEVPRYNKTVAPRLRHIRADLTTVDLTPDSVLR
jgi:terminal uridylyltransferase